MRRRLAVRYPATLPIDSENFVSFVSVGGGPRRLDRLASGHDFLGDEPAEVAEPQRRGFGAFLGQPFLYRGQRQRAADGRAQRGQHRRRRAGQRDDAVP